MTILTDEQLVAVEGVKRALDRGFGGITIGGLAGTGKTTLAAQLPELLGLHPSSVEYCAFTGKAADRLNDVLGRRDARTIHSLIYYWEDQHCERCPARINRGDSDPGKRLCHSRKGGTCGCKQIYTLRSELEYEPQLIIVDEASMVGADLYRDLNSFGVPVVWIGDHGQLPPVGDDFNPMEDPDFRLETIHRQVADSPILRLAMKARRGERIDYGTYGPGAEVVWTGGEMEWFDDAWPMDLLLLCGYNRTRVDVNRRIRRRLGYEDGSPDYGDRVICLKNNRDAGIYNGMLGVVRYAEWHRPNTLDMGIALDNGRSYEGDVLEQQFGAEKAMNVSGIDRWDFGYCVTVHKAQGSEADRVVLKEEWMGWLANPPGGKAPRAEQRAMHARWLYTGITRAKRELILVRK